MGNQKAEYDILLGKNTLSKGLKDIDADLGRTEGKMNMLNSVVAGNLISSGVTSAAGFIKDIAVNSVQAYGKFEQFGVALTTMFHGNKLEAKGLSDELQQFAKETPFELTEIQAATKQMIAFGSTSRSVVGEMRMLGDVGSGIGSSLGDLAYLYGTVRTQGRAMTMDINQFANRGIPIWKELEKITKKNGLQLRKFVEDGQVGFPMIEQVFKNLTKEGGQFFNMMQEQSGTMLGKWSNLQDAWGQFEVKLGESKKGILSDILEWSTKLLNNVQKTQSLFNQVAEASQSSGTNNKNWFQRNFEFGRPTEMNKEILQQWVNFYEDNVRESIKKKDFALIKKTSDKIDSEIYRVEYELGIKGDKEGQFHGGVDSRGFTKEEVRAEYAMLINASKNALQMRKNFTDAAKEKKLEGGLGDKTTGTGTTIEAGTPKNLYINITNFLPNWKIESMDGSLPTKELKEQVGGALLELINDAHLAQR